MTRREFLATVVAGGLVSPSGLSAGDSGAEALDDAREPGADPASVFEEEVFVAGVFEQGRRLAAPFVVASRVR